MQKIPFYLVPNRITLTTDRTGYTTELRKVYQRQIKLYKGIDNTIELEIKNSDGRRPDVMGRTVEMHFFDQSQKKMFTASGSAKTGTVGIMEVIIPKIELDFIDPQMLNVAVKFSDEQILYSDSQFGLFATAEIFDGFNEKLEDIIDELLTFNYEFDKKRYTSEIAIFGTKINNDYSTSPSLRTIRVEVIDEDYQETITVEGTRDKSTAFGIKWEEIGTITPAEFDSKILTGDWRFVRFSYPKYLEDGRTLAGTVDKIILRN